MSVVEQDDELVFRRRTIKVHYDDGDHLITEINGTKPEIREYYIGVKVEITEHTFHSAVSVEFLG